MPKRPREESQAAPGGKRSSGGGGAPPPQSMSVKEMKAELTALSIDCRQFIEKTELVDALMKMRAVEARKPRPPAAAQGAGGGGGGGGAGGTGGCLTASDWRLPEWRSVLPTRQSGSGSATLAPRSWSTSSA